MNESNEDVTRVMIISPISSVRVGLRTILEAIPGVQVIGEAATPQRLGVLPPNVDIVIIASLEFQINFEYETLIDAYTQSAFLFLVNASSPPSETGFQLNRPMGFLDINAAPGEIEAAVRALTAGLAVIDPHLVAELPYFSTSAGLLHQAAGLSSNIQDDERDSTIDALTRRENEILQALALGLTNKEIARQFGISEHTVKYHVNSLYSKLGVNNRTEAVRQGIRLGWVTI